MNSNITIELGIAILCPSVYPYAANKIEEISKHATLVSHIHTADQAHISLFQGNFLQTDIQRICAIAKEVCLQLSEEELSFKSKPYFRSNGNVFWLLKKNNKLLKTHYYLLEKLLPWIKGPLHQFKVRLNDANTPIDERNAIQHYGSVLCGEKFLPHLTLCSRR